MYNPPRHTISRNGDTTHHEFDNRQEKRMEANTHTQSLWTRRSSKCDHAQCVTVSRYQNSVAVFDSIAPETALSFPDDSWRAFLLTFGERHPATRA